MLDDWSIIQNMGKNTKDTLIYKGIEITHSKGFNNTGIQEILKACDIPKGSFYFYFSSKDDFGLQMIEYYAIRIREVVTLCLGNTELSPMQRFADFFGTINKSFIENGFKGGCLLGNFAQEMGDLKVPFQERLKIEFASIQDLFANCLVEAQNVGEISADIDADALAEFMLNSWEGALMRMKVEKNTFPLDNCMDVLLNSILGKNN
jgi:TetR/AcrR family transcriptional regulator, transcriptional repressor for nem operon